MVERENFKFLMESIKNQIELNRKAEGLLQGAFDDFDGFIKTPLIDQSIGFLEKSMYDINDYISYYAFDLDFGREESYYKDGGSPITDSLGNPIPLKTLDDLYDRLVSLHE